jgi:hypothetical protein
MEQTTDPIATNDGPGRYQVIPCPVDQGITPLAHEAPSTPSLAHRKITGTDPNRPDSPAFSRIQFWARTGFHPLDKRCFAISLILRDIG